MKTIILAIDPGTTQSAYVRWDGEHLYEHGIIANAQMFDILNLCNVEQYRLVIEQIRCYGKAVGASTLDTVMWSGRFFQHWLELGGAEPELIPRMDVKMHICHSSRAKDGNIRQALIDRFGEPGTKKSPGLTYGLSKDAWQAFALAVYAADKEQSCQQK
jgi:hypothetical protein